MNTITQNKDERINLRLKEQAKRLLERAASFEGQTISKFVLNSALAHAEKTIQAHEVMRLNTHDSETFYNALASPTVFNDKLASALEEHEQRVNSQ